MTKCNTCANAIAAHCKFIGGDDADAVLRKMGITDVEIRRERYGVKIYRIKSCPSYKRGPLPPVQWRFG